MRTDKAKHIDDLAAAALTTLIAMAPVGMDVGLLGVLVLSGRLEEATALINQWREETIG